MKLRMRHTGGGRLAVFDGDEEVREIGVTPGWNFRDRDEVISRFNEYQLGDAPMNVPNGWKFTRSDDDDFIIVDGPNLGMAVYKGRGTIPELLLYELADSLTPASTTPTVAT